MIELYQLPYSPYCIVQRRLLEFAGARFKIINIPNGDRSRVWRLTRQRYYAVPVIRDGRSVIFETSEDSQVIAKYLDTKFGLGLFPAEWEGVQSLLWRYFEGEIEAVSFKLNDIYWEENLGDEDPLSFIRYKERKFGRGCLALWHAQQESLLAQFTERLAPCEQMLAGKAFLLGARPLFADFDLFGMLGNFLYSGHYRLPAVYPRLAAWHGRMSQIQFPTAA